MTTKNENSPLSPTTPKQVTLVSERRSKSPARAQSEASMVGNSRVKLCWGSEIRMVQLPHRQHPPGREAHSPCVVELTYVFTRPQVAQLYARMREEFGHDNFEVRTEPSPYWKMGVRCISAKHLPKADRAGLCDAYCEISMENPLYEHRGYTATPAKLRTKVSCPYAIARRCPTLTSSMVLSGCQEIPVSHMGRAPVDHYRWLRGPNRSW